MPNILKSFLKPKADAYVFPPARSLMVEEEPEPEEEVLEPEEDLDEDFPEVVLTGEDFSPNAPPTEEEAFLEDQEPEDEEEEEEPREDPFAYAKIQAEALMRDAEAQAEAYRDKALRDLEKELDQKRRVAREEGYHQGYAAGMADAMAEAKEQLNQMAEEQIRSVQEFLAAAARQRDRLLDESREELKELALAVAEKVIQVSLKNSDDIILRMVDAATDTHRRCEWAHIYVADCDVRGRAYTVPELTAALSHISERVRVIPMADDESGTCIVELPDVIYDASVSTQLNNIREVLANTGTD